MHKASALARDGNERLEPRGLIGRAACALLLGVHLNLALADDSSGNFALKGAAILTCQTYLAEREKRSNVYHLIGGWIEGYLSAHNRYVADTFDITSFETTELLLALMAEHCGSHPDDRIHAVFSAIIKKLAQDRLRSASEQVRISDDKRTAILYRETIRRMQTELTTRHLYKGAIDGNFSNATRAALVAFQKEIKLEPTGFPDQVTLWRLLRK